MGWGGLGWGEGLKYYLCTSTLLHVPSLSTPNRRTTVPAKTQEMGGSSEWLELEDAEEDWLFSDLDAFAKFRKVTIIVTSGFPSARKRSAPTAHWTDFHGIWFFFSKICQGNSSFTTI